MARKPATRCWFTAKAANGEFADLTHDAKYQSLQPAIAKVAPLGIVYGIADGKTEIVITAAGKTTKVQVEVQGSKEPQHYHFENDIMPLFARFGCNSAGCHGNSAGQNGFKLSVFGFDPPADLNALLKEARGRRVMHAAPGRRACC